MGSATVHPGELDQVRARYENELAALRARLAEAEETLRAIRSGEVDALVVQTAGDQIFTLSGADRPYRVMVETMQEGAATVSDGGLVLYANRRLGELLGTPLHRLIGTSASSFVATDDRAAFEHLLRSAAGGGVHTDLKLQRAERDPFTVRIAASPLDLDDTHAVCLVITDLRFHHVFDDAPIGVVTVSVAAGSAGQFLQVNHAMCQLTGYSTDELLSLTVADVTHPDDVAETHDIYRGAATGALSQFREEQRYLRADGGVVWASTNGTVVRDRDGHPSYVIAHVEDITARKQAEHALADSEKRFRSVFFDAPIGVVMVGLAADPGRYLQVNQAFCDIIGYRADELGTRRFTDISHPDDGAGDATFLAQLLDNSLDGVDREKRYLRPDGTVVWASIRASTIRDEHGRPLYALAHIEDITARRQAQEQLSYQALHDPLTGLGNRHLLMARLQHALDALDRAAGAVAVLYIDLDGFKAVNDRVGHDTGDRFLIEIGRHIQHAVRRPDTAVRLGGDEFVVVAVGINDDSLLSIVERIKAAVTQSITIDIDTFTVSASVGVVVTHNSHDDPTDLLRAADLAMYQAKKDGRGRHQIFTDALRVQAMEHLDIEPELRRAIGRDLLRLYYQPVMDVRTGHAVGVEALLRLQHPTRGLLTPDAFLDVAETSGLIVPIGDWVLQHACRQQAAWQANLPGHLQMAVNLSGRQVLEYGLCDRIAAAIDDAGVDPHRLTIELTETVFTEASRSFLTDLDTLKARGVRFALDDFGTGYSSLAYLERFPVDIVKIDQRFVAGLGTNPHNTTIVTAIVNLGRTLGLDLVAEGVETPEQLARLADLGCDFVQGFYLQRPVPPGELDLSRTMPATPR